MRKFIIWSSRHPWPIVVVVLIVTLIAAFGATKLYLDASTKGMMIQADPTFDYYQQTLDRFGTDNITVIYVKDSDLFSPEKLKALDNLVFSLGKIKGVTRIESLFSVTNFKGVDGGLETSPLIDWIPEDMDEAVQIKTDALRNPMLQHNVISADGTATAINLFIEEDELDPAFAINFTKMIEKVLSEYGTEFDELFQIGMTYT